MKVQQLRRELQKRGQPPNGSRAEMAQRLLSTISKDGKGNVSTSRVAVTSSKNMVCCCVYSEYQSISPREFILLSINVALSPIDAVLHTGYKIKKSNGLDCCKNCYRKCLHLLTCLYRNCDTKGRRAATFCRCLFCASS